jgi:hypothetical protein
MVITLQTYRQSIDISRLSLEGYPDADFFCACRRFIRIAAEYS